MKDKLKKATAEEKENCEAKGCMGNCDDFNVLPCGHRTRHLQASCPGCGMSSF